MENIREFLEIRMGERGWKPADLARRANVDSAVISNIINGRRGVGKKVGNAIAHAFMIPPEEVFRAAGLLPPISDKRVKLKELEHLANLLGDDDLEEVIDYARHRLKKHEEKLEIKQTSRGIVRPARNLTE